MFGVIDRQYKMKINEKTGQYICSKCGQEHTFYEDARNCSHKIIDPPAMNPHYLLSMIESLKGGDPNDYEAFFKEMRSEEGTIYVPCLRRKQ